MIMNSAKLLSNLLAVFQAMHQSYWAAHWQTEKHELHMLFERLYLGQTAEIDTLAEKIVGIYGEAFVNAPQQLALQTVLTTEWDKESNLIYRGVHMEEYLQRLLSSTKDGLKKNGDLTLGLEDFLAATASTHETNQYLLGQQAKARLATKTSAVYDGNLGMAEMFKFYSVATPSQERLMDKLLDSDREKDAWELLKKVTGVNLRDVPGMKSVVRQAKIAGKGNQIVVETPSSFHPVKLEPPKAKRKKYPFEGFINFQGLEIDIENASGSTRKGVGPDGPWTNYMHSHYGEIRKTEGTDGDKLDVYVGPNHDSSIVVVIHQVNPWDGKYDEDKVMIGFDSVEEAIGAYKKQYDRPGFYREGEHTAMPMGAFWRWVTEEKNKGKKVKASHKKEAIIGITNAWPLSADAEDWTLTGMGGILSSLTNYEWALVNDMIRSEEPILVHEGQPKYTFMGYPVDESAVGELRGYLSDDEDGKIWPGWQLQGKLQLYKT